MQSNIEKTQVLILDTETTGITAKDQVIELAYITCGELVRNFVNGFSCLVLNNFDQLYTADCRMYNERFKPTVPINPHAYKVHGISMLKLLNCRPSSEAVIPADVKYLVGHNISFDHRMLNKPDVLLIDTLVLTRTLRKLGMLSTDDMEGKDKLDVLIKHHFPHIASILIKPLHNALYDCYKVILLLSVILEKFPNVSTWDALYELQTIGKKK